MICCLKVRAVAAGLVLACGSAFVVAQDSDKNTDGLPSPAPNAVVNAVTVKPGDGVFKKDTDEPIAMPTDMPKLSTIPPKTMSYGGGLHGGLPRQQEGRMIMYDATTGKMEETPAAIVQYLPDMSGGGFGGAYPQGSGETTDWNSTMSTVSDANLVNAPFRMNVKVAMRFARTDGTFSWFVCSGTMIDAETVLTAGHCIYERGGDGMAVGFATEVYVYPGWDGTGDATPNSPDFPIPETIFNSWGFARGTSYATWSTYTENGDWDGDVALVRVTRAVGMLTGWYGWNYGSSCSTIQSRLYRNNSYPAQFCAGSLHTGAQMYTWNGFIDSCPDNQLQIDTNTGCLGAVWGGMSGSSMYYEADGNRFASAVCSTSNRSSTAKYARLFEGFVNYMNDTFIPDTRTNTFDLQALDCNITDTTWNAGSSVSGFSFLASNPTNANPGNQTYNYNIYLSSNTNISESDTLLEEQSFGFDYAAMQNVRVNTGSFTIPLTVSPGNYYLGVVLDTGTGGDSSSANNDSDTWDAVLINVGGCVNPPAPTGVVSVNFDFCDRNRLTWTDIPAATSYQVWRSTTNDSATATLRTTTASATYDDLTALVGTVYYYWVKAVYPCGTSGFSAVADGERNSTPSAPTNVNATDGLGCGAVTVSWTSAARATGYRIYRATVNSSGSAVQIATDTASPYVDNTAIGAIQYYYWVRAENDCGISGFSLSNAGSTDTTPGTVTGVSATDDTSCTSVNVTWNAHLFADSYNVYRSTINNTAFAALVGNVGSTNYFDVTAVAGTTYYYWVKPVNDCGVGANFSASNAGRRRTLPAAAPTGLVASDATNTCPSAITLTWNSVTNADFYRVYRNTVNDPNTSTLIANVFGTNYSDATAAASTVYFYWVRSANSCGTAAAFSTSDQGSRGGAPTAPTTVTASDGTTCQSVTVAWTHPLTGINFRIYRNTVNNILGAVQIGTDTASPYIDNTVVGTTTYFYWVRAETECGLSGYSLPNSGFAGSGVFIDTQPANAVAYEGQTATFTIDVGGATNYRWRKNGVDLVNGGDIDGATSDTLYIFNCDDTDEATYTCFVSSRCGNALSQGATLTVLPLPCPADFNQDGGIDGSDVEVFFSAFEAGEPAADVNFDGGIDGSDVDYFLQRWENGAC